MKLVNMSNSILKGTCSVSKRIEESVRSVNDILGVPTPDDLSLTPIKSPGLLMHWRVQVLLCGLLGEKRSGELREAFPRVEEFSLPEAWDSHFHLDRLAAKARMDRKDLKQLLSSTAAETDHEVQVSGGCAIFCDAHRYPSEKEVADLNSKGFVVGIGIHPKSAPTFTEEDWAAFATCVAFPGVTALGEVGIDYTVDPCHRAKQHIVLDRALSYLQPHHVLVLHCRRNENSEGDDMLQLLYQLKNTVPKTQRIHLHCFSGSSLAVEKWCEEFDNMNFGYTSLTLSRDGQEALRNMAPNRLLLETDAPYFRAPRTEYGTPAHLGTMAKAVAKVRGEAWQDVLCMATANAKRLYLPY